MNEAREPFKIFRTFTGFVTGSAGTAIRVMLSLILLASSAWSAPPEAESTLPAQSAPQVQPALPAKPAPSTSQVRSTPLAPSAKPTPPPDLTADRLEYRSETHESIATGSARARREGMTLTADSIRYNDLTNEMLAEGHAVYEDEEIVLTAEAIRVNMETKLGEATGDATIFQKSQGVYVKGEQIQRLGESDYHIDACSITTCSGDSPAWSFYASDVDFHYGQSVSGWNVRFRVRSVPLLYSPYFWWPALIQRQSGFLLPEIGYSNDLGSIARIRYYWMMAVNHDATIEVDYYSERGIGTGVEYRYMTSRQTHGEVWVYHLDDEITQKKYVEGQLLHDQRFGSGGRFSLNLKDVTEKDFYREFSTEREVRIQRYLTSTAILEWRDDIYHLQASGIALKNLQFKDWVGSARIADVGGRIFLPLTPDLPLYLTMEAEGRAFHKKEGAPDKRVVLLPEVTGVFRLPFVTVRPSIGYDRYFYYLPDQETLDLAREVLHSETAVAATFFKPYGTVTHYIEPSVTHRYRLSVGEAAPFLDQREFDVDGNTATVALINRITAKQGEIFNLNLSSTYDLWDESGQPWSSASGSIVISHARLSLTGTANYNIYDKFVPSTSVDFRYRRGGGNFIAIGHRYAASKVPVTRDIMITASAYTVEAGIHPIKPLRFTAQLWYDAIQEDTQEMKLRAMYEWQCWGLELIFSEKQKETDRGIRHESRVMFAVTLKGLGKFKQEAYDSM